MSLTTGRVLYLVLCLSLLCWRPPRIYVYSWTTLNWRHLRSAPQLYRRLNQYVISYRDLLHDIISIRAFSELSRFLFLVESGMNKTRTLVTILNRDSTSSVDYTERAGKRLWTGYTCIWVRMRYRYRGMRSVPVYGGDKEVQMQENINIKGGQKRSDSYV